MNTLIVITGPTAVGKTALTIDIARRYGIPVINADSRQIYREMPIGTAAPTVEQLEAALKEALACGHGYVIDCAINIDEMVRPMVAAGSPVTKFLLN